MKKICLLFTVLLMLSCNANSRVTSTDNTSNSDEILKQETKPKVSFISGTRQQVLPGIDDGSGRFTENYILKLDVPRDYEPQMNLELMGYLIPIDRQITYISEEEKAMLMFTVTYPLMDNYDEADNPALAIPILFLKNKESLIRLDLSGCSFLNPVAYPSINKEGGN